jgi:hypothetical protein
LVFGWRIFYGDDLIEYQPAGALTSASFFFPPEPCVHFSIKPAGALEGAGNDNTCPRDFLLMQKVGFSSAFAIQLDSQDPYSFLR